MSLSFFGIYKRKVLVHLKSGTTLTVRCDDVKIKSVNNELTGYEFFNKHAKDAFYIRLDDISAIELK